MENARRTSALIAAEAAREALHLLAVLSLVSALSFWMLYWSFLPTAEDLVGTHQYPAYRPTPYRYFKGRGTQNRIPIVRQYLHWLRSPWPLAIAAAVVLIAILRASMRTRDRGYAVATAGRVDVGVDQLVVRGAGLN